jgi:predicted nucleic acid-binding protein
MARVSIDANILVYGVDESDPARSRAAQRVILLAARGDCVLLLQALAEFYFVVTRKGKLAAAEATAQVNELRSAFPTALPGARALDLAMAASQRHRIGFWDAMFLAVAREAGVGILLTEDLNDDQVYDGVRCLNPFKRTTAQLAKLMRAA